MVATRFLAAAAALTLTALPAFAQTSAPSDPARELPYDRGYDKHTAKHDAVDAREAPVTADLNRIAAQGTATGGVAPVDQAQYEADRIAYMEALVAHDAQVNRADARYARQQIAYADAMRAWRNQVRACEKGYRRACNAPTPNPADYY